MSATVVVSESFGDGEPEMKRKLVVTASRTTATASAIVGTIIAALWIRSPHPWEAIGIVTVGLIMAASLASVQLGQKCRPQLAAHLLVATFMVMIGVAGLAMGGLLSLAVAQVVPVALAGLLLRRWSVMAAAAGAAGLYLLQLAAHHSGLGIVTPRGTESMVVDVVVVLGMFGVMAMLASECSDRLRSTLAQMEMRARDAEQRALELELAKGEIERRASELALAQQEIEAKTRVSRVVAGEIRTMAEGLACSSREQAGGAAEQAAAMGEIVATMEELSQAAGHIAAHSAGVSQQVSSALQAAESGHRAVEETIAGLDRIRGEVRSVAEKNLALGQKTQAIGEIIEVISEIADRTHLLALNAAIESAAAGEYGRRFSVVASQVKELATEAKSAAHQVRSAVAEIQRAASATVLAAEKSETDVEVGAALGRGAGEAIGQIVGTVEEVATAAREMLMATQQQRSASEQVVSSIRQIEQITRQSAEGSRQVSEMVNQLTSAADRLQ